MPLPTGMKDPLSCSTQARQGNSIWKGCEMSGMSCSTHASLLAPI